jgi:hypothetical protein
MTNEDPLWYRSMSESTDILKYLQDWLGKYALAFETLYYFVDNSVKQ